MEVLAGGRRVGEPDVALGGELHEALDPGARMLWPGAFVAVGQQQRQARCLPPLGLAGDDEGVDDHLRRVGEVAELRFPEHEAVGRGGRVAVLEAEAGDLRERAVVQLERRQGAGEVLDRRVLEAGLLVVEEQVAVGEGAALGVLAGQADMRALGQQRGVGERLGVAELDQAAFGDLEPLFEGLAQLAVDREAVGNLDQLRVEGEDPLLRDRRLGVGALGAIELAGLDLRGGRVLELAALDPSLELLVDRAQLLATLLSRTLDVLGQSSPRP